MISRNTRFLSVLLVVFMMISTLASLSILPAFADETENGDEKVDVTVDGSTETPETPETPDGETTPGEGETTPGEGETTPGEGETTPGEGETTPGEGTEGDKEETPKLTLTIEESIAAYLTTVFESREEKLATMTLKLTRGDYQMYVEPSTGEVAVKNTKTGQIILSNPYDVATVASDNVKSELLSQVVVSFKDIANNNQLRTMYSYADSAQRGQIIVKNIKNGIRLEYTLGKQAAKKLMPYWMEAQRFEQIILTKMKDASEAEYRRFMSFYSLQDPNDPENVESYVQAMNTNYPCTKNKYYTADATYTITDKQYKETERSYLSGDKMAIYVIDPTAAVSERESNMIEGYIKQYVPEYNFEEVDYDIELTGYVGDDSAAAIFTLALEWYLDEDGFRCEVPLNSLTYDEDAYLLDNIIVNQFMGCTSVKYDGYAFFPDGAGTIITNEDIKESGAAYSVAAEVYGPDFAYHKLFYNGKSEVIYMPVYGIIDSTEYVTQGELIEANAPLYQIAVDEYGKIIRNEDGTVEYAVDDAGELIPIYATATEEEVTPVKETDADGKETITGYYLTANPEQKVILDTTDAKNPVYYLVNTVDGKDEKIQATGDIYKEFVNVVDQGFVAIIDGGESLARVSYSYGGISHNYCSIYSSLRPIPTDSYNLQEAISVGQNQEWTVTSERKFTGRYSVKYFFVSDFEGSKYEGNYVGMAKAYRDYLEADGVLTLLDDTKADIPLYIESFGMIQTQTTFLTIPVWADTPLTTFDDVKTMYKSLAENTDYKITNINFRLKGFTSGGMDATLYPTTVGFEKVLGGDDGYESLISDAKKNGYGIFPEFDFVNVTATKAFDGFSDSKWTIKTIDDRYASKREYDATYQSFLYIGAITVSPAYFSDIFEKFVEAFGEYTYSGISVSTLGKDLNSDFDADEPFNREDNKEYSAELLEKLYKKYGDCLMTDGGNAYSWKYVKHILNVTLDSSRYLRATTSVPFIGIVLHGYMNIAGTPTNMEGDTSYEILKIIENGASPYFTLSYQNTNELKEFFYEYYSVDFEIWLEDLIKTYKVLNEALKDVQNVRIDDHKFITGDRVLTEAETAYLAEAKAAAETKYAEEKAAAQLKYDNAMYHAEKEAVANGKTFDREAYIEEVGEFEFVTFDEYYQSEIDTFIDDYSIVHEVYENGVNFILNFNSFPVKVTVGETEYTVDPISFVKFTTAKA